MPERGNGGSIGWPRKWNELQLPLHFQTGENERPHRLRVVAARLLRDVILIRAVAVAPFAVRVAAEADHGDGAGDVVAVNELLEDAGVRAAAVLAIAFIDIAEAGGFQQDEGEHRRCR